MSNLPKYCPETLAEPQLILMHVSLFYINYAIHYRVAPFLIQRSL